MDLKQLFTLCSMICDKHINKNPQACISYEDKKYLYTDIKQDLENLCGWCYPMDTKEIKKCTLCNKCKHYKPGIVTVVNHPNIRAQFVCDLDKLPKNPNHYCGYGEENEV